MDANALRRARELLKRIGIIEFHRIFGRAMNIVSPITFIDKLVKKNELGQPFTLMDHQRKILRLAFAFDKDGRLTYDTIIYSTVKKSGKTTINGALDAVVGLHSRSAQRDPSWPTI
jgi:hypothetical protein